MAKSPNFDPAVAHEHFSKQCFNQAWELMEKHNRTHEDNRQMIQLSQASLWHWTQRKDCTRQNMAVGYWQASRIYSIVGEADNARRYGELSLDFSKGESPFFLGYAYEALARAEMIAGNQDNKTEYLNKARQQAETISNLEEKKLLLADLESIK